MRCEVLPSVRIEKRAAKAGPFLSKSELEMIAKNRVAEVLVEKNFCLLLQYLSEAGEVSVVFVNSLVWSGNEFDCVIGCGC